METSDRILKRDAAGRVWTPREQREAALDAFERSGLPARQFAAQIGVKYATFANWVAKRRQQRQEVARRTGSEGGALGWVEATVETPAVSIQVRQIQVKTLMSQTLILKKSKTTKNKMLNAKC